MEFEKFRDGILQLAAEIRDMSHIISFMREFYINIPITIVEATPPFLARCRPNFDGQIFERKSEISYNPKVSEIRLQRANFDSQQVFYGALPTESDCDFGNCQNTALLETVMEHVKDHRIHRQLLTLSRWKIKRTLNVCMLPFSERSCDQNKDFKRANDKYLYYMDSELRHFPRKKKEDYLKSLQFISEIFCQKTNKQACYRISAVYYNLIMYYAQRNGVLLDGLIYPSANTGAAGMNVVLRKELADANVIKPDYVLMMEMIRDSCDPKKITFDSASEEVIPDTVGNFHFARILTGR